MTFFPKSWEWRWCYLVPHIRRWQSWICTIRLFNGGHLLLWPDWKPIKWFLQTMPGKDLYRTKRVRAHCCCYSLVQTLEELVTLQFSWGWRPPEECTWSLGYESVGKLHTTSNEMSRSIVCVYTGLVAALNRVTHQQSHSNGNNGASSSLSQAIRSLPGHLLCLVTVPANQITR